MSSSGSVRGMTTQQLVTFAFVSQGFIVIVGAFGDNELAQRIRTGDVVIDLYRPFDLQLWWMASWFGRSAFQVIARGLPPVLLGAIMFDLRWPDPWWHWLAFIVAVALAATIGFANRFCSNLTTFWLLDNRGIDQMITIAMVFFAGLMLPINLFPGWLETIARLLPFASMIQLPTDIYLGQHGLGGIVWVLAQQAGWAVAALALGRFILMKATPKVVIQRG
ncbi:MAG: ABC-2 type transport system permease protein [Candidatus Poriferisodalaceae bacterium]|jgi:ABC-2 type transport system permease protein